MENLTKAKINLSEGIIELEGSEDFVQKNLDIFKDVTVKSIKEPKEPAKEEKTGNGTTRQPRAASIADNVAPEEFDIRGGDDTPSFKEFLNEKKPSDSAQDMISVTGFYLQHYLKKEEFSEGNVMYAYIVAGVKRPKKVHQSFINTKNRQQYIKQGTSGDKWVLTQLGEDHVRLELPPKNIKENEATKSEA